MNHDDDTWAGAQRRRWMCPNAHLWIRPDAYRFMAPDAPRLVGKDAVGYFWPGSQHGRTAPLVEHKYSPDQPRDDLGRWVDWIGREQETSDESGTSEATDFSAQSRNRAQGHHYVPRAVYDKLPLSDETRSVFEGAKTGQLYDIRSNKYDEAHRSYNDAVGALFENFVTQNKIQVERMTPDQGRLFLREVLISQDPRIRSFNMLIQTREIMQRVFRRPLRSE